MRCREEGSAVRASLAEHLSSEYLQLLVRDLKKRRGTGREGDARSC